MRVSALLKGTAPGVAGDLCRRSSQDFRPFALTRIVCGCSRSPSARARDTLHLAPNADLIATLNGENARNKPALGLGSVGAGARRARGRLAGLASRVMTH